MTKLHCLICNEGRCKVFPYFRTYLKHVKERKLETSLEIPVQNTYSIKIEDTAKGLELMFMFMQTDSYVNRSVRMYGCIPDMYYG